MSPRDFPEHISVRDYQINLMDIAYKKNTIVYLPTGTGKTLIAVMLLKKLGEPLQKTISQGGKISIMLANTTALVDQHSEYLKRLIPFEVGTYSGSVCNKTWSKTTWKEKLDKFQVFVMTPRVLCNILSDSTISFSDINLLIFDECHRAVHNHPMSEVMKTYDKVKGFPRILGLTATLLNKNCNPVNVISDIKALEKTLHSEIVTVESQHTTRFSTDPKEIIRTYNEEELSGTALDAIQELHNVLTVIVNIKVNSLSTSSEKILKDLKSVIQDTIVQIETFGIYGGKLATKLRMNQLFEYKKTNNLDTTVATLRDSAISLFIWLRKIFKNEVGHKDKSSIYRYFSNRLLILLDILKQHKKLEKQNFCAIVFVKRRLTVKILYKILSKLKLLDPEYSDLSPNFVLGSNSYSTSKSALLGLYKAKVYKRTIEQFCKGHINLLVTSNVLEEGIDIPTCTLIINFDEPKDYRGYVQSKGRARSQNSNYYVLISETHQSTFMKSHESYKQTQEVLKEYFSKEPTCYEPSIFEVEDSNYEENTSTTEVAITNQHLLSNITPSIPDMNSAVDLLNLYCSSLPHDKYTIYLPQWFLQKYEITSSIVFKANLRLPIICQHLGLIEGPYMGSKELAINATALKTCNLLKEKGELDDNWLPKSHTEVDDDNLHFFQHWLKYEDSYEKQTTNIYEKTAPNILRHQIQSGKPSFVHVIELKPTFGPNNALLDNFGSYKNYTSSTTFGFVTAERLPEMCDFNVYVPEGAILVTIEVNKLCVTLTTKQIQDLRIFHYFIFKDVLGLLENFLIFDNDENTEMLLMIPVYKQSNVYGMNFDILQLVRHLFFRKIDNSDEKSSVQDTSDTTILGKVVSTFDENYLICSLLNNELQGRLLVKEINCLKRNNQKIVVKLLKSDSCFIQEFPSDLWVQAILLPSILYRIITILQVVELRDTIMTETGLTDSVLYYNWLPLDTKKNMVQITDNNNTLVVDESIISMKFDFEQVSKVLKEVHKSTLDTSFVFLCYKMILSQILLSEDIANQRTSTCMTDFLKDSADNEIELLKEKQGNDLLQLVDLMKALTGMKCNDIINYERAETLGDSFLKFSISLFIILKYPDYNEGKATVLKSRIISNKNLFYASWDNKLYKYVRNTHFTCWKPPGFTVPPELKTKIKQRKISKDSLVRYKFNREEVISGVLMKELEYCMSRRIKNDIHTCFLEQEILTNKTLADCVEALLGVYFESYGIQGGLKMLIWLKIVPPSENVENLFKLQPKNPLIKPTATDNDINFHIPSWKTIEESLGYHFHNRAYLLQALTHSSYNSNYLTDCYQRLEFLGDAVLDFLITCHIYESFENLNPGDLTDLRSALVNNVIFAGFTVRCGFYKYMLLSNQSLLQSIDSFVRFQDSRSFVINDNVLILSEENNLYIAEHVEVPKALGDLYESLAAAVFLDCGMNLQVVWKVFYRIMRREIEKFAQNVPKNPVRVLYETIEAQPHFHDPVITDTRATMVCVDISLTSGRRIAVYGFGENKRCAKKAAATLAVRILSK